MSPPSSFDILRFNLAILGIITWIVLLTMGTTFAIFGHTEQATVLLILCPYITFVLIFPYLFGKITKSMDY